MSAEHSAVQEIPFIQDHQFRYGEIETVAPGIRRLTARNAGAFTYHGTGTYIVGQGEVAVIDPGPDDPDHIDTLVSSLSSETISHILVTHCHRDHSPGARLLQTACDAPTYAFGPHAGGIEHDDSAIEEGVDTLFTPDNPLQHGECLTVGDCEIECIHTPGHTSNHMCFAVPGQDSLFSGDHVMAWSTSVVIPPDGNMADYLASLALLCNRTESRYWPTHGPPLGSPHDYVQALIAHRLQRMQDIIQLLKTGPWRIADMVEQLYPKLDIRLHGAASRSIFAAILYLQDCGEIEALEPTTLDGLYQQSS